MATSSTPGGADSRPPSLPPSTLPPSTLPPSTLPPETTPGALQEAEPLSVRTQIMPREVEARIDEHWTQADSVLLDIAELPSSGTGGAADMPTIGHIGRYALKYVVGEGGLGTVYAAHDPLLSRLIAIKTLHVDLPAEEREQFNALFLDEARAAGSLSHAHIVTVFDAGISPQGAFIAMELLKGKDLRQLLKTGWKPTPGQAALIVRRVADALAYAHHRGVVHRDIKPANIFMLGRTQPRVLDFGIARVAHRQERIQAILGSPYYMAPEQLRQAETDRRTDVYSLGVVLYELLVGRRPYEGETLADIHQAVLNAPLVPPQEAKAGVPPGLSEIVVRAMAREPEHRYRSARALAADLRTWIQEHPQSLIEPDAGAERRRTLQRAAVALLGAAGLGIIGLGAWQGLRPSASSASAVVTAPAAAPRPAATDTAPAAPVAATATTANTSSTATPAATAAPAAAASSAIAPVATPTTATPGATTAAAAPNPPPAASAIGAAPKPNTAASPAPTKAPVATVTVAEAAAPGGAAKPAREPQLRKVAPPVPVAAPTAAQAPAQGSVSIAVSPWGQVEVNGSVAGISPPLTQLKLGEGRHVITLRNDAFAPHSVTINVVAGETVSIKHRFGP